MLKIQGLHKKYGNYHALDGLDMELSDGALFGFVGPNGAGKTTTIKIMTGLLKPDQGSVTLDGTDMLADTMALRRRIGYVPDHFGLYDNLKVSEYMEFFAACYHLEGFEARKRARNLLEQVGLGFKKELSTLQMARDMGMITMSYCYNVEEAKMIADAGIDIIVSHMGLTKGGDVGTTEQSPLDVAAEKSDRILRAAKDINPRIITMCHGGSITSPEDAAYVMDHSAAVGFVGASSIERIPTEIAIKQVCKDYLSIKLK